MTDDFSDVGPKLRALLNDSQRKFVVAYAENGGNAVQACHAAGYSAVKMTGFRLLQRADVQAALDEVLAGQLKALTPATFQAMRVLVEDPNHKDHAKAVFAVLDRTGFHAKSEHHTVVDHNMILDADLPAAIRAIAKELGVDATKLLGRGALPKAKRLPAPVTIDITPQSVDDMDDLLS